MPPPVRKIIVDYDKSQPPIWYGNGASCLFQQRLYFSNFSAAATTINYDITGFPTGINVKGCYFLLSTEFSGGTVGSCTVSAGTTALATAYVVASNCFTGAGATIAAPLAIVGVTLVPGTFMIGNTIRIQLVTTVANGNALTAGVVDFYADLQVPVYRTY